MSVAATLLAIDDLLAASTDVAHALGTVVARLGHALDVHRVVIFRVHDVPGVGLGQTVAADWAAAGIAGTVDAAAGEAVGHQDATLRDWSIRRRRGEGILAHTSELGGHLREAFERQGIVSTCSEPIFAAGDWWGHLGVGDCRTERAWTADEQAAVRLVARGVGRALEHGPAAAGLGAAMRAAMIGSAPDGIIVIDEDGCACEFNPAAEAMFGVTRRDIVGRAIAEFITPPHLRARHDIGFRRYIETGAATILGRRVATEGQRADGSLFPLELTITEVKAEGRRLFAAYVRDLTALKAAEAVVARQRDALHQSEKLNALGSLLAGVAHEMNNPLAVVVGRAVMLEEEVTDPAIGDQLRRLREAAERCARIAGNFLTIARKSPVKRASVDVAKPLRAALELNAYGLRSTGVATSLTIANVPPVLADEDQLLQVFSNLIVNAEHALREAPLPRTLEVSVAGTDGGHVRVTIADNGPGIAEVVAGRIFEPFFTTKPVGMGTGIGLSVSRGMIEANEGTLAADPHPGRGARFVVTLPAALVAAASPKAVATLPDPLLRGARVLVVDDDAEMRALLAEMLHAAGCIVETAADGAEALAMLRGGPPVDAVLADARMPVLDGLSLYRAAVAADARLASRFALITGDLAAGGAHEGGGPPVIEKPFHLAQVRAFLARAIGDR